MTAASLPLRNIGIFAHVDAGKTTLSEQMLLRAGAIREAGSVDRGTAHTDSLPVERRRGISVRATCVRLQWKGTAIHLIDTPGHTDFTAEIERSLWALDGAVLVVSAAEGVEPQTELLYDALKRAGIPLLFFLNKCDREGADIPGTLGQIRRRLKASAVPLFDRENLTENVCGEDEALAERYLAGEDVSEKEAEDALRGLTRAGKACPVLAGSALKGEGIEAVLDAVTEYLPPPENTDELCGVAFAAEKDRLLGRGVWIRLWGGTLKTRDTVTLPGRMDPLSGEMIPVEQKITQIRDVRGADTGELKAGEIGIVYGLGRIPVGRVIGNGEKLPRSVKPGAIREPLMTVRVLPEKKEEMEALRAACEELSLEDPLLQARYSKATDELQLRVMGTIQLEILQDTLETRFGLKAGFDDPTVVYRETIARAGTGFAAYTMPKPCWAVLEFTLEPGERGSGVQYSSVVPVRDIMARYQHQVEQALPLALRQGRLGWEVTDIVITLTGGNHHLIHTHPMDFILATPWAIHDGLRNCGSVLLEPMLEMKLLLPAEYVGKVMSDVAVMRGEVLSTETDGDRVMLTALVPAAESMDYPTRLAAATGGRGGMAARLHSWRECPMELGHTAKRRTTDPLDTAKYILAARSAMSGGVFDMEQE